MKVYLTSEGEYSDWHITGVFSSYEKAFKFGGVPMVWELDEPSSEVGAWYVIMTVAKADAWCEVPSNSKFSAKGEGEVYVPAGEILCVEFSSHESGKQEWAWYSEQKSILVWGHTREGAIRKARDIYAMLQLQGVVEG